jgi:hypothetical protein
MPAILNSWKEIATYMDRGVRTVQTWESDGLPIRRVGAGNRAPVFALIADIDKWLRNHRTAAPIDHVAPQSDSRKLLAESERLVSTLQRSGADFLFLDLDIAFSLAKSACTAGADTQKKAHKQKIARRAYDTILQLSRRLKMTKQENGELREKLAALRCALEELGEHFDGKSSSA